MENLHKFPFIKKIIETEHQKAKKEVLFWEQQLLSEDKTVLRQAKGNIESSKSRVKQFEDFLSPPQQEQKEEKL